MNLVCCSVAVVASRCRHVSSHLFVFFFLRCMVEMLVNAGQEMDSARGCKYKFSINLVKKKPEYRTNPVNYPFGIQFILRLSMPKNSGISGCHLVHFGLFLFVCLVIFFCC